MEDTWGSSSLGIFLLTASVGRFIIQRLRVGHQQRRGGLGVGGVREGGGGRQVCFYVFSFLPFEKQGDLQVAHQGPESIKLARRELQPHV